MSDLLDSIAPPTKVEYDALLRPLSETKFWVTMCAVLGFLMSVFMLIVGLFFLVGVPAISAFLGGAEAEIAAMGASFGIFIGLIYVIVGGILFMPPLYLYRYAKSISKAERSGEYTDIIEALRFQKSFWKFAGVIVLIYLIFMAIFIFFGLIAAFL